jgi:hypothetical protein
VVLLGWVREFPRNTYMMDKKAAAKLWVEQWHRAGPVLQKLRHDEPRDER